MHEQSDSYQMRDRILNHRVVRDMDPHERHALSERLKGENSFELYQERRRLTTPYYD